MHRMDEDGLTKVVHRLVTATLANNDTAEAHFKEIVMNVLHEHAKAFEEEMRGILVREAEFASIANAVCAMLEVPENELIPSAIAELKAKIASLEEQV